MNQTRALRPGILGTISRRGKTMAKRILYYRCSEKKQTRLRLFTYVLLVGNI